jgi:hypothetical protein
MKRWTISVSHPSHRLDRIRADQQLCPSLKRRKKPFVTKSLNTNKKLSDPRTGHYLEKLLPELDLKTRYSRKT